MRICDLCKSGEKADSEQLFHLDLNGIRFTVEVSAAGYASDGFKDLCPDCAAKGALMVLGAEKPKCADGKCNCPPVEM